MEHSPIIIEQLYKASIEKIWKAITDKDEMKKWYFDLKEFKAEKGFQFDFTGGPSPERQYLHLCEITEIVPKKKLTYSWKYDGYNGISYVTFELSAEGDHTRVKLTHSELESFPANNSDFAKENFEEGWNHILTVDLKGYLETN